MDDLEKWIDNYPDFPSKGILFRDISPLLADPEALRILKNRFLAVIRPLFPDYIAGIDARGFLFCTMIAEQLGLGALMIRKPGKLPGELMEKSYKLEYGSNSLSIQKRDLRGKSVVIIDDLLATGGSMQCSKELLESAGANVLGGAVVIELKSLKGSSKLDMPLFSLISYED
mgnify:FL=1|tara:strand:- start:8080 stop:8595 length:516 start_codon:yes stop_codon:yes gene_type:complete